MKREVIRVEPRSTWRENWTAPTSAVAAVEKFWPGRFDIEIDCIAAVR
jgi:hypothetical protein